MLATFVHVVGRQKLVAGAVPGRAIQLVPCAAVVAAVVVAGAWWMVNLESILVILRSIPLRAVVLD